MILYNGESLAYICDAIYEVKIREYLLQKGITDVNKLHKEAPYHALTNAGHISYIELDGDPSENLDAFERVVRIMKEEGIGYGAVNHPVDRDPVCGYVGVIGDVCPGCGRREGESVSLEKITTLNCGCK